MSEFEDQLTRIQRFVVATMASLIADPESGSELSNEVIRLADGDETLVELSIPEPDLFVVAARQDGEATGDFATHFTGAPGVIDSGRIAEAFDSRLGLLAWSYDGGESWETSTGPRADEVVVADPHMALWREVACGDAALIDWLAAGPASGVKKARKRVIALANSLDDDESLSDALLALAEGRWGLERPEVVDRTMGALRPTWVDLRITLGNPESLEVPDSLI